MFPKKLFISLSVKSGGLAEAYINLKFFYYKRDYLFLFFRISQIMARHKAIITPIAIPPISCFTDCQRVKAFSTGYGTCTLSVFSMYTVSRTFLSLYSVCHRSTNTVSPFSLTWMESCTWIESRCHLSRYSISVLTLSTGTYFVRQEHKHTAEVSNMIR